MKLRKTKKSKEYIPRTEAEKEQVKIRGFLDLCSPSVLKFYPDYYICGNAFRSVWAIREYPTKTDASPGTSWPRPGSRSSARAMP